MSLNCEFCILKDEKEIIEYEKMMYKSYSQKAPESLEMNHIYEIIDNCRMRPKIPYNKMITYGLKINGAFEAGLKINLDIDSNYILETLGFTLPEKKSEKTCEGMNFFALGEKYNVMDFFNSMEDFGKNVLDDVEARGIKSIYGVCDEKIKIVYIRIGYKVIDKKRLIMIIFCY